MSQTPNPKSSSSEFSLGDYIRRERARSGWNQEQLAEQLGVCQQTVSSWEIGRALPSSERLDAMSRLFGVSAPQAVEVSDHAEEKPTRHLRTVSENDTADVVELSTVGLTEEQKAFRSAITARIKTGDPLSRDEIAFYRDVAGRLYGLNL